MQVEHARKHGRPTARGAKDKCAAMAYRLLNAHLSPYKSDPARQAIQSPLPGQVKSAQKTKKRLSPTKDPAALINFRAAGGLPPTHGQRP